MKEYDYNRLARLVKKAADGNSNAFAELYAATYQKQYQFAYRYLRDEYLAQDAIQEVYILALKNLVRLKDAKLFIAWLKQINFRVCFDMMKKRKLQNPELCNTLLEVIADDNQGKSMECQVVDEDMRQWLLELIQNLPSTECQAIIMRYYNHMPLQEIANAMDCSLSSVKRYIAAGQEQLKKTLLGEVL